eukprot:3674735-Rhodomonas_salina.1
MPSTQGKAQRASARDGVPAETAAECILLSLPPTVLGHLWPAQRVVVGLRVCTQLRRDLPLQCASILLVQKADTRLGDYCRFVEDFGRIPLNLMVTLKWRHREEVPRLVRVLGECKALAHLNFSQNKLGDEGARRLAGVLGECKMLAHLNLSQNKLGDEGAGRLAG